MGHFLKLRCAHSPLNLRILSSTSVPFTLTTVQVPNLALIHTKWITVQYLAICPSTVNDILSEWKTGKLI